MRKRGWRELIVLLAALACAGSWAASQVRSMRDRSEVAQMTEKMKTVCVGRYLVDVPAQAEVSFSGAIIDGFTVETFEESDEAFSGRLAAREIEIAARGTANDGSGGMVEARDLRIPGISGRTFMYGRNRSYWFEGGRRVDDEWVAVEIHAHVEGLSVTLTSKFADEAAAASAEALVARLQVRGAGEVPATPGFCVERAVFAEPLPAHTTEHTVMHVGLPGHPDLSVTLASIAGGTPGTSLLTRVAKAEADTSAETLLRMNKLREGKRSINGIEGEEVLVRARELNFTTTYGFSWDAPGTKDDVLQPYLSLELQTGISERSGGKPVETSLHEDALLSLWETIASSIRLRKSGPPPSGGRPQEPSGPQLGATASAGEFCPQSGWWRCNAGGPGLDVHGGQVQFIRQGDRMPQALLLPQQTLWQKLKRIQPSVESAQLTVWTLVDKRHRPRGPLAVALAPALMPASGAEQAADGGRAVAAGTFVRTGDACPASGWWRCLEPHALDGTRWFAQGSLLPAVSFQVPPGVFAKSAGPEVIQRRSAWQLMRHAGAPAAPEATRPQPDGLAVDEPPALV
jgi:hypothetical protein